MGLYDNHHVVKQTGYPVQTLGDIGGDAADDLSAEPSLADDLHAFSFASEDVDQQVGTQLCSAHPMPLLYILYVKVLAMANFALHQTRS